MPVDSVMKRERHTKNTVLFHVEPEIYHLQRHRMLVIVVVITVVAPKNLHLSTAGAVGRVQTLPHRIIHAVNKAITVLHGMMRDWSRVVEYSIETHIVKLVLGHAQIRDPQRQR